MAVGPLAWLPGRADGESVEALGRFANEAASAAKADGKERSLEPMSSADRRVVHDALSDVDGVETRSAGSEPRRRVGVVPTGGPQEDENEDVDTDVDTADGGASDNGVADEVAVD